MPNQVIGAIVAGLLLGFLLVASLRVVREYERAPEAVR